MDGKEKPQSESVSLVEQPGDGRPSTPRGWEQPPPELAAPTRPPITDHCGQNLGGEKGTDRGITRLKDKTEVLGAVMRGEVRRPSPPPKHPLTLGPPITHITTAPTSATRTRRTAPQAPLDLPVREARNSRTGDLNPQSHARAAPAFLLLLTLLLLFFFASNLRELRTGPVAGRDQNGSEFPASSNRNNNPARSDAARLHCFHAACLAVARLGSPGSAATNPPPPPRLDRTTAHPEGRRANNKIRTFIQFSEKSSQFCSNTN